MIQRNDRIRNQTIWRQGADEDGQGPTLKKSPGLLRNNEHHQHTDWPIERASSSQTTITNNQDQAVMRPGLCPVCSLPLLHQDVVRRPSRQLFLCQSGSSGTRTYSLQPSTETSVEDEFSFHEFDTRSRHEQSSLPDRNHACGALGGLGRIIEEFVDAHCDALCQANPPRENDLYSKAPSSDHASLSVEEYHQVMPPYCANCKLYIVQESSIRTGQNENLTNLASWLAASFSADDDRPTTTTTKKVAFKPTNGSIKVILDGQAEEDSRDSTVTSYWSNEESRSLTRPSSQNAASSERIGESRFSTTPSRLQMPLPTQNMIAAKALAIGTRNNFEARKVSQSPKRIRSPRWRYINLLSETEQIANETRQDENVERSKTPNAVDSHVHSPPLTKAEKEQTLESKHHVENDKDDDGKQSVFSKVMLRQDELPTIDSPLEQKLRTDVLRTKQDDKPQVDSSGIFRQKDHPCQSQVEKRSSFEEENMVARNYVEKRESTTTEMGSNIIGGQMSMMKFNGKTKYIVQIPVPQDGEEEDDDDDDDHDVFTTISASRDEFRINAKSPEKDIHKKTEDVFRIKSNDKPSSNLDNMHQPLDQVAQPQIEQCSTLEEENLIIGDYVEKREIATKAIGKKLMEGHSLTHIQCIRCQMPMMESNGETNCVVCPLVSKRAKKRASNKRKGFGSPRSPSISPTKTIGSPLSDSLFQTQVSPRDLFLPKKTHEHTTEVDQDQAPPASFNSDAESPSIKPGSTNESSLSGSYDMAHASREVYRRLLEGWLLTKSNCQVCFAPLMQSPDGVRCIFCHQSQHNTSQRNQTINSTHYVQGNDSFQSGFHHPRADEVSSVTRDPPSNEISNEIKPDPTGHLGFERRKRPEPVSREVYVPDPESGVNFFIKERMQRNQREPVVYENSLEDERESAIYGDDPKESESLVDSEEIKSQEEEQQKQPSLEQNTLPSEQRLFVSNKTYHNSQNHVVAENQANVIDVDIQEKQKNENWFDNDVRLRKSHLEPNTIDRTNLNQHETMSHEVISERDDTNHRSFIPDESTRFHRSYHAEEAETSQRFHSFLDSQNKEFMQKEKGTIQDVSERDHNASGMEVKINPGLLNEEHKRSYQPYYFDEETEPPENHPLDQAHISHDTERQYFMNAYQGKRSTRGANAKDDVGHEGVRERDHVVSPIGGSSNCRDHYYPPEETTSSRLMPPSRYQPFDASTASDRPYRYRFTDLPNQEESATDGGEIQSHSMHETMDGSYIDEDDTRFHKHFKETVPPNQLLDSTYKYRFSKDTLESKRIIPDIEDSALGMQENMDSSLMESEDLRSYLPYHFREMEPFESNSFDSTSVNYDTQGQYHFVDNRIENKETTEDVNEMNRDSFAEETRFHSFHCDDTEPPKHQSTDSNNTDQETQHRLSDTKRHGEIGTPDLFERDAFVHEDMRRNRSFVDDDETFHRPYHDGTMLTEHQPFDQNIIYPRTRQHHVGEKEHTIPAGNDTVHKVESGEKNRGLIHDEEPRFQKPCNDEVTMLSKHQADDSAIHEQQNQETEATEDLDVFPVFEIVPEKYDSETNADSHSPRDIQHQGSWSPKKQIKEDKMPSPIEGTLDLDLTEFRMELEDVPSDDPVLALATESASPTTMNCPECGWALAYHLSNGGIVCQNPNCFLFLPNSPSDTSNNNVLEAHSVLQAVLFQARKHTTSKAAGIDSSLSADSSDSFKFGDTQRNDAEVTLERARYTSPSPRTPHVSNLKHFNSTPKPHGQQQETESADPLPTLKTSFRQSTQTESDRSFSKYMGGDDSSAASPSASRQHLSEMPTHRFNLASATGLTSATTNTFSSLEQSLRLTRYLSSAVSSETHNEDEDDGDDDREKHLAWTESGQEEEEEDSDSFSVTSLSEKMNSLIESINNAHSSGRDSHPAKYPGITNSAVDGKNDVSDFMHRLERTASEINSLDRLST